MTQPASLATRAHRLAEDRRFQNAILIIILFNAVLVGLETMPALLAGYRPLLELANAIILAIFIAELAIRIAAHGWRVGQFLRDGWNVFDLVVVALSLIPGVGAFATVGRMARVLRVARLVSLSPKLRLIVGTMMRSIPSLMHVSLLLGLLLYMYAVIGVNLFGAHDPEHWGGLGRALLTLFQMLTLEGWVEIQAVSLKLSSWAWIYLRQLRDHRRVRGGEPVHRRGAEQPGRDPRGGPPGRAAGRRTRQAARRARALRTPPGGDPRRAGPPGSPVPPDPLGL